jgi:hypothetical protein
MVSRYFQVDALGTDAMHAEAIAALDALKLVSLVVTRGTSVYLAHWAALQLRKTAVLPFCQSTHRTTMGFIPERRETSLIAPIGRDPCEKRGLAC